MYCKYLKAFLTLLPHSYCSLLKPFSPGGALSRLLQTEVYPDQASPAAAVLSGYTLFAYA